MKTCGSCGSELMESADFCSVCGSSAAVDVTGGVTPSTPQSRRKSNLRRVGFILFPIILVAGTLIFFSYLNPSTHGVIRKQPKVTEPFEYGSAFTTMTNISFRTEGGNIIFSLDDLKKKKLVKLDYVGAKTARPLLAFVAPDGRAVTAISLSEHCGSTDFKIKEEKIHCANCPSNWDMMTMQAYACCAKYHPDPIPSTVVGNEVHIPVRVVENWSGRY